MKSFRAIFRGLHEIVYSIVLLLEVFCDFLKRKTADPYEENNSKCVVPSRPVMFTLVSLRRTVRTHTFAGP